MKARQPRVTRTGISKRRHNDKNDKQETINKVNVQYVAKPKKNFVIGSTNIIGNSSSTIIVNTSTNNINEVVDAQKHP